MFCDKRYLCITFKYVDINNIFDKLPDKLVKTNVE